MSIPNAFDPLGKQGFTRVQYLQSSGTQWIDTGLTEVDEWEIETKFRLVSVQPGQGVSYGDLYGYWRKTNDPNDQSLSAFLYSGNGWSRWSANGYINVNASNFIGRDIIWNVNADRGLIDGNVYNYKGGIPLRKFSLGGSVYVFARHFIDREQPIYDTVMRIYYFTIRSNNVPILNLVPTIDSQRRPCMLDLISQKPFYNVGNGEFLYG